MIAHQLRPRARPQFGSGAGGPSSSQVLSARSLIFWTSGPGWLGRRDGCPTSGPAPRAAAAARDVRTTPRRGAVMGRLVGGLVLLVPRGDAQGNCRLVFVGVPPSGGLCRRPPEGGTPTRAGHTPVRYDEDVNDTPADLVRDPNELRRRLA